MEEGQENSSQTFNLYPNPAAESVTIAYSSEIVSSCIVKLTDMTGRVLITDVADAGLGENTYVMNLNGISKGMYLVELTQENTVSTVKLIVQ
jgi:hypothetical protein